MNVRRRIGVAVTLFAAASAVSAQPPPVFRAQVELVRVDVAVSRDGMPVPGLGPMDFDLRDNQVRQTIRTVLTEYIPLDVILVLDTSSSVAGRRLDRLRDAATMLLRALRAGDRAALMTFSHRVSMLEPLTPDLPAVARRIRSLSGLGWTSMHDGIYAALLREHAKGRRTVLVVFSDGLDTISWLTSKQVLTAAKRSPAIVYVVAELADPPIRTFPTEATLSKAFLKSLADDTGGRSWWVPDPEQFGEAFGRILQDITTRYVLLYQPENVSDEGWHTLRVTLTRARGDVVARAGYYRQ